MRKYFLLTLVWLVSWTTVSWTTGNAPCRAQEGAEEPVYEALDPALLEIGCPAPDIVAGDLDQVEFKLSDYRGKVVVLDFWGDW